MALALQVCPLKTQIECERVAWLSNLQYDLVKAHSKRLGVWIKYDLEQSGYLTQYACSKHET